MDINNLKAFIEVADKKSFSRSAESLKLTQPAVSKRVAALESELSAKLFDRAGRNIHLTEAGRMLLPSARQISAELSRIEDVICNLGKEVSGVLSIGTTEQIGIHHLPRALKPFREKYPGVNIELRFASSPEILKQVEDGQLELALCSFPGSRNLSPRLLSSDVWSGNIVVVVDKSHPLAAEKTVSLQQLLKHPSILPPETTATRRAINDVLTANNLRVLDFTEAHDIVTMKTMASLGLGWTCLPEFQVDDSLAVLAIEEMKLTFSIAFVTKQDRTLSRAAEAFIETTKQKPEFPD